MIYLASPYWHEDPKVRQIRYEHILLITRGLIRRGMPIFSPIVHGHSVADFRGPTLQSELFATPFELSHDEWLAIDFQYLKQCSCMVIAQLEGWGMSKGVAAEITFCDRHNIPRLLLALAECQAIIRSETMTGQPA